MESATAEEFFHQLVIVHTPKTNTHQILLLEGERTGEDFQLQGEKIAIHVCNNGYPSRRFKPTGAPPRVNTPNIVTNKE